MAVVPLQLEGLRLEPEPLRLERIAPRRAVDARRLHEADERHVGHRGHHRALAVAVAAVAGVPDRALHVALARGEPHLADEDVLHLHRVHCRIEQEAFIELGHLHRAAFRRCLHRVEVNPPLAVKTNIDDLRLTGELNLDLLWRNRALRLNENQRSRDHLAPDRHLHAALQHCAVGERRAHFGFNGVKRRCGLLVTISPIHAY